MTERELRTEISSGKLKNIYVFYGQEQYALRKSLELLVSVAAPDDDGLNRIYFEGTKSKEEIADAVFSLPFFSERKIILWSDMPLKKDDDKGNNIISAICDMMLQIPPTNILVIYFETTEIEPKKMPAGLKKLIAAAEKCGGAAMEFSKRSRNELIRLLMDGAKKRKCQLDSITAGYMIDYCGEDLSLLVGELSKVAAYCEGVITKRDIDLVCIKSIEVSIYDLSKKLIYLDVEGTLTILEELLYNKTPAMYILTLLSGTFVDMYRAKVIREKGDRPENYCEDFGYSEKMSFKLKNADRDSAKIPKKVLSECLAAIDRCDALLKSSKLSEKVLLESLINEIAVLIGKSR